MQHPRSLRRLALSLCAFSLGFSFWSCAKADTGDSESVFSATKTYPLIISEYIHEGEKRAIEIFNTGNKRDTIDWKSYGCKNHCQHYHTGTWNTCSTY